MKNRFVILLLTLVIVSLMAPSSSSGMGKSLKTQDLKAEVIRGTFTVILYGGRFSNDIETVAILDLEGDQYTFEPYAPEFDYRIKKGLSAEEALHVATSFVSGHHDVWTTIVSRILDYNGTTIGYEVRPIYHPLAFGLSDVLDIDYSIKGTKVRVMIRLKPPLERQLFDGGGISNKDN
jgi:hypothetical protein